MLLSAYAEKTREIFCDAQKDFSAGKKRKVYLCNVSVEKNRKVFKLMLLYNYTNHINHATQPPPRGGGVKKKKKENRR